MAVNGRRDLHLAPSTRAGFEMSVLRMLAFRPAGAGQVSAGSDTAGEAPKPVNGASTTSAPRAAAPVVAPQVAPAAAAKAQVPEPASVLPPAAILVAPPTADQAPAGGPVAGPAIASAEEWLQFASSSGMRGAARQLAENAGFVAAGEGVLSLSLDAGFDYLRSEKSLAELEKTLAGRFGTAPRIVFDHALAESETLQQRSHRERNIRQSADEENFMNNPEVQRLIQQHGARLVPDSIRPFDE
ncbi:MAG: DNA polymerase III subunit gamma/tau, partial [Pseudoxanthomonas sp.]